MEARKLADPLTQEPGEKNVVVNLSPEMQRLAKRLGRVHLRQRLGLEGDHATHVFGWGRNIFHIENWYSVHGLLRLTLKCLGLYARGQRNARAIQIRHNRVDLARLPPAFEGFTILQLSDLHLDMHEACVPALVERLPGLEYDICVMTGDFRARTFGNVGSALAALKQLRPHIHRPVYAVLGNHDSIRMVSAMEDMGMALLMNEAVALNRSGAVLYLAGVDDPHYFRMDNLEKAAQDIPPEAAAVLLAHSPEIFRRAAYTGFDLMLSGHTHGGQLCLPGGIALLTNADCPRRFCAGAWRYGAMQGYTSVGSGSSVVDVRFNCPPEITLHHLHRAQ